MHTKTLPKNLSCRFGEWVVEERPYPGKHALRDSQVIILSIYFLFSSTLLKQQKPPYVIKCLTLDHCQESWHYNRKSSHWVVVIKVNYPAPPPQKKTNHWSEWSTLYTVLSSKLQLLWTLTLPKQMWKKNKPKVLKFFICTVLRCYSFKMKRKDPWFSLEKVFPCHILNNLLVRLTTGLIILEKTFPFW